jgi:histidinol-phosphate aminotransferase
MTTTNRRTWIKSALAVSAGIPLSTMLIPKLEAMPVSKAEIRFWKTFPTAPLNIRLNANENPYGPSPKARQAVNNILNEGNRYPFTGLNEIKNFLAEKEGVTPDHIMLSPGSSEALSVEGLYASLEGGSVMSADPTFTELMNYAQVFNARWDKINVNDKLELDYGKMLSSIKNDTRLIFIVNPNNPTGTLVNFKTVREFCLEASKKAIVFSDEAYLEFLDPKDQSSMVDLVRAGENVIVCRTFSKIYGLAGLRMGYLVAKPDIIKNLVPYQMGFPISQTAIAAAMASYGDTEFMNLSRNKNKEARQHLETFLDKKGYFYGKSHTNFMFFECKTDGQRLLSKMTEKGIGMRIWDYNHQEWCRVSIGTLDEMKMFTKAWDEIVS